MKKSLLYALGGIVLITILGFGYYAISPLFKNIRLEEASPVFESIPRRVDTSNVKGTTGHPASGHARIVMREDGAYLLRYTNFKTINGPDLYVYLSKDLEAKEFINLGPLKATEGNINYEIPADVGSDDYRYALVWCKAFGVLFNYADLLKVVN